MLKKKELICNDKVTYRANIIYHKGGIVKEQKQATNTL